MVSACYSSVGSCVQSLRRHLRSNHPSMCHCHCFVFLSQVMNRCSCRCQDRTGCLGKFGLCLALPLDLRRRPPRHLHSGSARSHVVHLHLLTQLGGLNHRQHRWHRCLSWHHRCFCCCFVDRSACYYSSVPSKMRRAVGSLVMDGLCVWSMTIRYGGATAALEVQ